MWGSLSFILGAAIASYVTARELTYLRVNPDVVLPRVQTQFPLLFFFGAVVIIGLLLFLNSPRQIEMGVQIPFRAGLRVGCFYGLYLDLPDTADINHGGRGGRRNSLVFPTERVAAEHSDATGTGESGRRIRRSVDSLADHDLPAGGSAL